MTAQSHPCTNALSIDHTLHSSPKTIPIAGIRMHNSQAMASTGMEADSQTAHDNSYGNEGWVDMNPYTTQSTMPPAMPSTMPDYGTGGASGGSFVYMGGSMPHGLPSESISRMPPPPPPAGPSMFPSHASHTSLPMLLTQTPAQWPSMLTNPSGYGPQHLPPPMAIPSVALASKSVKLPAIQTGSTPRRTLTDEDRKKMCQYAEEHPNAKQTEIGQIFGVERSTVSKVLRQKEKYLAAEDRSASPAKGIRKGKSPDVERTLTNWIKNAQKSGVDLSEGDIEDKARFFASTTGSPSDTSFKKGDAPAWLQKFMQKNGLGSSKLMRRASETNIPDSARSRQALSPSQPSSAISPASPQVLASPSPLSASRGEDDKEGMPAFMDFGLESGGYKHTNSHSTTSLSSAFTDTAASSFSGSALSPSGPFSFSPDPNVGGFLSSDDSRQIPPGSSNFHRPRSQTFPTLDLEYMSQQQQQGEPLTPKYHVSSTAPSSALESPAHEMAQPQFALDSAVVSPQLQRRSSSSSLVGRQTGGTPGTSGPAASTPLASSPGSPTQEDARRAADTLLHFLHNVGGPSFVDQNDYNTVVRLTEKLRLHQHQLAKAGNQGIGGLSRIPEGDSEMTNAPPVKPEPTTMSA